ncbi:lysophospholipid acyltransferase family protein [Yinghuangia seranimata]|uniref:lysophospholipid acyltransferase family protein n=1 Tax=Yinghuangia seranimata TaxID=408067 RepID=UPI00248ABC1B|nr:lysophospholipid acyltransferase family protein [Yinghuangia seranimata]MDI2125705.1 lysophospholipid acyltransferase family protein [Yinghuangia seranimata]
MLIYHFMHRVVSPTSRAIWRPHVEGRENVPKTGGVLIASNHLSFCDSLVIPITAPRQVTFLAKAEYFEGTGIKGAATRAFFEGLGAVGVPRDEKRGAMAALEAGKGVLDKGMAFGIYPEGTRSLDGRLYRGRTGVAWLALTARVPVVPVGVIDTEKVQPIGSRVPKLRPKAIVKFGEPLDFSAHYDRKDVAKARREVTDEIMDAIQKLSGQEAAGVYNERPTEG